MDADYYKIEFYVPSDWAEKVKFAVFSAGAGKLGNYDSCCWQTPGTGQFRPGPGSQPFIGKRDMIEQVDELKIEMICRSECVDEVISALKQVHPYETPAYACWPVRL